MKAWTLFLALALAATPAAAQRGERGDREWKGKHQGMSKDERQRMRDDMREVYRERNRADPPRQMSPQEREKLRQDIDEANRRLKR